MHPHLKSYAWIAFLLRFVACQKHKHVMVMGDPSWMVCPPFAQVLQDQCVGEIRFHDLDWDPERGTCVVRSRDRRFNMAEDPGMLVCFIWYRKHFKKCSPQTQITDLDECKLAAAAEFDLPPRNVLVENITISGSLPNGCAYWLPKSRGKLIRNPVNNDGIRLEPSGSDFVDDQVNPTASKNQVVKIAGGTALRDRELSWMCRRTTAQDIADLAVRELEEPSIQKRIRGACRLALAGIEGAKHVQKLLDLLKEGIELQQAAAAAIGTLVRGTDDVREEIEKHISEDSMDLSSLRDTIGELLHTAVKHPELRNWVQSTDFVTYAGAAYLYNYLSKVSKQRLMQAQHSLLVIALPIVGFLTFGFAALLWHVRRRVPIIDISMKNGENVLTTIGRHGMIRNCGVVLKGTGVPWLDNPTVQIKAHILSTQRLSLHVEIDTVLDNAHGDCLEVHMVDRKMKIKSVKTGQVSSKQLIPRVGDQILCVGRNKASQASYETVQRLLNTLNTPTRTLSLKLLRDLDRCDTSMGTIHLPSLSGLVNAGFLLPSCVETALCFALAIVCGWSLPKISILNTNLPRFLRLPDISALWGLLIPSVLCALPVLHNRARVWTKVPIETANSEYFQILRSGNPSPQYTERGPSRAITSAQLMSLFNHYEVFIKDRTMYYLDNNVIRPLTSIDKMSFSEVAGPSVVEWFVSHYWGTAFCHFVQTIHQHSRAISGAQWGNCSYWICSFSNNQWCIESEVGTTLEESSFYLALHSASCQGTTMVMDELALPLTRSWCCFEVLHTCLLQDSSPSFRGLFLCTSSGVLNFGATGIDVAMAIGHRLATLSVQEASASHAEDKLKIDASILATMKTFEAMDDFLRSNVRNCLHAARSQFERDFEELHHLLEHTKGLDWRSDACSDEGAMSTLVSRISVRLRAHARNRCQPIERASVPPNLFSTLQSGNDIEMGVRSHSPRRSF